MSTSLYKKALDYFSNDVIECDFTRKYAEELIYCFEKHKSIIDFDFWTQYEELLNEKITYPEYAFIDGVYEGDPLDVSENNVNLIKEFRRNLNAFRIKQLGIKYECDDLFEMLDVLVERNVKHYKTDYELDKEFFKKVASNPSITDRDFIWFTRDCGTQCAEERAAYIDGTYDHAQCYTFLHDPSVEAFFVHIDGIENNKITGSVYSVEPLKLYTEIMNNKVPAAQVELTPKEGDNIIVSYYDYNNNASFYYRNYDVIDKKYLVKDEHEEGIQAILKQHESARNKALTVKAKDILARESGNSLADKITSASNRVSAKNKDDNTLKKEVERV